LVQNSDAELGPEKDLLDSNEDVGVINSRQAVKDTLVYCLEQITLFDSYNQINFNDAPEKIIHMVKGFIHLGGFVNINVGFDTLDNKEVNEGDVSEIKRLVTVTEQYKEAKHKFSQRLLLTEFFSTFQKYNDLSYELIDVDSPLRWIIDCPGQESLNFFEYCIEQGNIDLAMKLIESCDISEVISMFPLQERTISNLLNSPHIFEFLKKMSKEEEKIKKLIDRTNILEIPIMKLENSLSIDFDDEEDGNSGKPKYTQDQLTLYYFCYLKDSLVPKVGKEIPYFNLLFFNQGQFKYSLDELVKVLPLDKIKELNSLGYQIGKIISQKPVNTKDLIEI